MGHIITLRNMTDAPTHRLLLVHAHPDDETIGQGATMAKYVAEGAGVTLVTCTAGEMGEILVPELEHLAADKEDRLGEHRRVELADAMAELGVTDHRWLGGFGTYRDSGMAWHPDGHAVGDPEVIARHPNAFWNADLTEAADHLVAVIREVRPQVLVTYDQFGGYGHPDHIQAHRVAMYAAQLAAVPSYRPDLGEPWDIAKVYWTAISLSRLREEAAMLAELGVENPFDFFDLDDPPRFVVPDEAIACEVDGTEYADAKVEAMRAHASQITPDGPFFAGAKVLGDTQWSHECYQLVRGVPFPAGNAWADDLFAGLD